MSEPGTRDRSSATREAWAPRSMADRSLREPPKVPKPVRTPERKTTSLPAPWVFMVQYSVRDEGEYQRWEGGAVGRDRVVRTRSRLGAKLERARHAVRILRDKEGCTRGTPVRIHDGELQPQEASG